MVVGEIAEAVDLLVVGGGPGGYAAAIWAAQRGREVTLVDRRPPEELGGVCLREGCIPSKMLIDVSEHVTRSRSLLDAGLSGDVCFEPRGFQRRRQDVVAQLSRGVGNLLDAHDVQTRQGYVRFTRPGAAVLHTPGDTANFLEYRDVIIATGSRAVELPTLPFDGTKIMSSTDVLALGRTPSTMTVVGGGYIGVELGTAYAKLGAEVTIVEQLTEILPGFAPELVAPVRRRLQELGVRVETSTTVTGSDGPSIELTGPDGLGTLETEIVLVSVGRRPNTDELGLAAIDVTPLPDGTLSVAHDRRLGPHVAAIGDCTPGPALAHKAMAEAIVAVEALCGEKASFDPTAIPQVVFSDPPIAITGLSSTEARARGHDAKVASFPLRALGRAVSQGTTAGAARLIVDTATGVLLGAELVGAAAPELVAEATLAIEMGATAEDLSLTIHPHPTASEQLAEVAHAAIGSPLHTLGRVKEVRR
jgi:dihydrolipoamide dehydrogenase